MTRYYKATFRDGTVKIRSTTSRFYNHAWRFAYVTQSYGDYAGGKTIHRFGFSTSAAQAAANLNSELRAWKGMDGEVAACVPCTKQGAVTEAEADQDVPLNWPDGIRRRDET